MAFSYQEEVSNGVQTVYPIDFDFRNQDTIYVYKGTHDTYETQLSWRWASATSIELTNMSELPSGTKFYIRRVVKRDDLTHKFANASMRGKLVDEQNFASLYLMQELMDGFTQRTGSIPFPLNLDMFGNRIKNLGDALEDTDATNVRTVSSMIDGARAATFVTQTAAQVPVVGLKNGVTWYIIEDAQSFVYVIEEGETKGQWVEEDQVGDDVTIPVPSSSEIKLMSGETLQERADVRNVQALVAVAEDLSKLQNKVLLQKLRDDYPEFCVYTPMTSDGQYWHRWLFTNRFNLGNTGAPRMINCSLAELNPKVHVATPASNNESETTATAPVLTVSSSEGVTTGTWVGPATVITTTDVMYSSTVGDKLTYTVTGVQRITLRGLMAGNGGIGKVRVYDAGVEIAESNYLTPANRLVDFLATGLGNTTMHYPIAAGLDAGRTYTVEVEVASTNPLGGRVYQAGLLGYDDIAYNDVGYHGIFLNSPIIGEDARAAITSGSSVIFEIQDATKAAWKFISASVNSYVDCEVYDVTGTLVKSETIDAATSSLTSNASRVFTDFPKGTYYVKLTAAKTKPAISSAYSMYSIGIDYYDQTVAGTMGIDDFDNFDVVDLIADPNNGSKYMLIGSGNLELAVSVRRLEDDVSLKEFVGGIHAFENVTSTVFSIDGTMIDFAGGSVGAKWEGSEVKIALSTNLLYPEDSSQFATVEYDLRLSRAGYRVGTAKTTTDTCIIHNDFDIMFNCPNTAPTNQGENVGGGFELVAANKNFIVNNYDNGGVFIQAKQGSVAFSNKEYTALCYYTHPPEYPEVFGEEPFTVGNNYCLMQDRTDRTLKWYTRAFSGDETNGVIVPTGTTWSTTKIYRVVRGDYSTLLGF